MAPYGKEYEFHPINEKPLILDFSDCKYIEDVHLLLKHKFGLPNFCGENWSAVRDLLMDVCYSQEEPLMVEIENYHCMPKDLRDYCEIAMFKIFDDINDDFPHITFKRLS